MKAIARQVATKQYLDPVQRAASWARRHEALGPAPIEGARQRHTSATTSNRHMLWQCSSM